MNGLKMFLFYVVVATTFSVVFAREINVLIVGVSGSGKSSLIQNVGHIEGISSFKATPVTTMAQKFEVKYRVNDEDIDLNLIDTMGFASTDATADIMESMEEIILDPLLVSSIHRVVILIKAERNNPNSLKELNNVVTVLSILGLNQNNILSYITHMDIYDKKTKDLMKGAVAKHFASVITINPEVKCFASSSEIDQEVRPVFEKWAMKDVTEFIFKVLEHVEPFYPHDYKICKLSFLNPMGIDYEACLKDQVEKRARRVVSSNKRFEL